MTPEISGGGTVIPREPEHNAFERALYEANKRIAATDAETRSVGLNSEARERAKLVAELEEAAKRANTEAGYQNATVTDAQREKIEKLADAMEAAAKRQRQSHQELMKFAVEGQDFTKQFDQMAISAFGNIENAFASFITGSKDAKAAFHDMAQAVLADLAKMLVRMTITAPLAQAIGGAFGIVPAAPAAASPSVVPTSHTGYGPGDPLVATRVVNPAAFIGAPRFHSGIGPGERPVIIRNDESVLTPGQMRQLAPAAQMASVSLTNHVNVSMPVGAKPEDGRAFGAEIANAIEAKVQAVLIREQRAGGILAHR